MEESKVKFVEEYPDFDLNKLPSYIREIIDDVYVEGKTKRTLVLPDGRKYFLGNKLNDLTGSEWTFFTNSVINTNYSTSKKEGDAHHIRKIHPSPKPPKLLKEIIKFFTKENQIVFDYFAGVGGTLLASSMCNRRCLGIELNETYINAYKEANDYLGLNEQTMLQGDSAKLLKSKVVSDYFSSEKASLILIDPPYGNMMSKEKTGDELRKHGKAATPFSEFEEDLGNMDSNEFWKNLVKIIKSSLIYLKDGGHVVVFIKDLQPNGKEPNLLHATMIEKLNQIESLYYRGMKIWADQSAMLFPYGYPFGFVATQIHQYILIFKKKGSD